MDGYLVLLLALALPADWNALGVDDWHGLGAATTETVVYAGVYEWDGARWYWTSENGTRYWHDGMKWNESLTRLSPVSGKYQQNSKANLRGPQNRYGIQWAR